MGEVSLDTVAALVGQHTIFAFCNACPRDAQLDPAQLAMRYGSSLTVRSLRERLTCRKCGTRSREIRIVFSLPPR